MLKPSAKSKMLRNLGLYLIKSSPLDQTRSMAFAFMFPMLKKLRIRPAKRQLKEQDAKPNSILKLLV